MHLVLRVQTDDALRLQTEQEMERLRADLATKGITVGGLNSPDSTHFVVQSVPPAQDAAFRAAAAEVQTNFDRSSGSNGTYTFSMKPNIQVTLREESVVQARETIERRVNELGVTEPSIAQQGTDGDQILVQLPGVTDVERAKEIIRSTGLLELKIVEQGPMASPELLAPNGAVPAGMEVDPRRQRCARRSGRRRDGVLPGEKSRRRHRQGPSQRASDDRREQSAGGQLHAQRRWRTPVRRGVGRQHRQAAGDHPGRTRAVRADARRGGLRPTAASPAASPAKKSRTSR